MGEWRAKLVLHYDGRNFYGWQKQSNRRTVQGELESLLEHLCGHPVTVTGAGRTDRGVHATGQVAAALIPARFEETELQRALNAMAPPDLWIESAEPAPEAFHPRYDAVSRTYAYRIGVCPRARSPFNLGYCWPLERRPDLERMREATEPMVGDNDFGGFAKSGQPARGVRCDVSAAGWREETGALDAAMLIFEITADRFLHHMVRYLVGTLAEIGFERRPVDGIARLLAREPGVTTAAPAPPEGLFLTRVTYSSAHDA